MNVSPKSVVLVVMGVCGCGKTSVSQMLHEKLEWPVEEADDYHSDANKSKMESGIGLNDTDRYSWLMSLHEKIESWRSQKTNGIITCSALKRMYRKILIHGSPETDGKILPSQTDDGADIIFVYLKGSKDVLFKRMATRSGHFMPGSLLQSQLDILEEPEEDERHLVISIDEPLTKIVDNVMTFLNQS